MKPFSTKELGVVGYSSYHGNLSNSLAKTPPSDEGILNILVAFKAALRYL